MKFGRIVAAVCVLSCGFSGNVFSHINHDGAHDHTHDEAFMECASPPVLVEVVHDSVSDKSGERSISIIEPFDHIGRTSHQIVSGTEVIDARSILSASMFTAKTNFTIPAEKADSPNLHIRTRVYSDDGRVILTVDQPVDPEEEEVVPKSNEPELIPVLLRGSGDRISLEHVSAERAEKLRGLDAVVAIGAEEVAAYNETQAPEVEEDDAEADG